jgi:hypothetical protein
MTWVQRLYFSSEGKLAADFYLPPSSSSVFEPAILGSNGKYANHYITDDDDYLAPWNGLM